MIEATRDGMEYYYTFKLCSFPTVWFNKVPALEMREGAYGEKHLFTDRG